MPEAFTKRAVEVVIVVSRDTLARQTASLQDDDAAGIVIRERVAVIFTRRADPAKARWRSWSRPDHLAAQCYGPQGILVAPAVSLLHHNSITGMNFSSGVGVGSMG